MRVKVRKGQHGGPTREVVERYGVRTVCQSARCPNIGECFASGTATFMILGGVCTRNCGFCAVASGPPETVDPEEPTRVGLAARELGLAHVVVTSVTRDDLSDGGSAHFAATIRAIRESCPDASVEVLTPDFDGERDCVATVCAAQPDIYNHNVETVARLQPVVRPQADYERSLQVLRWAAELCPSSATKSGFMVGIGETDREVQELLGELVRTGCQLLTIGQYLQPSPRHLPVDRYVPPSRFDGYAEEARALGFAFVASGPFVRSSYRAKEAREALRRAGTASDDSSLRAVCETG